MNAYEALGRQVVGQIEQEALGDAGAQAFNWGTLINAAAEAANQGVAYAASKEAAQKAAAAGDVAAARAISADANWAAAEQQLELAQQSGNPAAIGPATALQSQAMQAAVAAGGALTPEGQAKRVEASQKAATAAARDALADPKNGAKQAISHAWQKVTSAGAVSAAGTGLALAHGGKGGAGGANWFTRSHAGLPTYAWLGGGALIGTGFILLLRALLRSGRK